MRSYVRARRPSAPANPPVRFVQDPTFYVERATMIPDGMHGTPATDNSIAIESTMKKLIAGGIHPERARRLVKNASFRVGHRPHTNFGLHRGWMKRPVVRSYRRAGLGDAEEDAALLSSVQAHGADVQSQHAALIAKIPSGEASGDKLKIRNQIDQLYSDWTAYAVGVKNGVPPFEWNRTDPVDAILIAIRDDLRNTVDLLDANKAQQVLAKQISALPKLGTGKSGPLFGVDVPWYVWAGGAAAAAAVAGKTLHLW
jgi:hypothetical protein